MAAASLPRSVASRLWEHRNLGYRGAISLGVRDDDEQNTG